ncbi:MAG: MerR family DNA-binding transcriptional regulator [Planctomycetes bacterium]|nr:MerR family DNA-binding transcriptional regulator [Planctomycetota bacterium]MCB9825247.1 MerR family DNA-binding transcriptional regulator [Planctomycetota bacterium]MCB9828815.1 MerR family DNA-binding transcriptional regulator [Planctomycetota bacterium]
MPNPDVPLTATGVARRLGVRPKTVLQWARQGLIPAIRITGKVVRFDWPAVLDAVRDRELVARQRGGAQ